MRVMISGAPATGKGTQCSRIVDKVRDAVHSVLSSPPVHKLPQDMAVQSIEANNVPDSLIGSA